MSTFFVLFRRTTVNAQKGPIGAVFFAVDAAEAGNYQLLGTVHLNPIVGKQPATHFHVDSGIRFATLDLVTQIVAVTARVVL